jgi:pimeloyl-ACP methyl ester carboxylesterase
VDTVPGTTPAHRAEYLHADELRLRAVRAGQGTPTLLLLHGYGESLLAWQPMFDRLARRTRVIAVDLPGFGLSDKPPTGYSLGRMTDRLVDFVDRWTRGPVIVVGHSLGGEIAAALALRRPDRISGLVLLAPAGAGLTPAADSVQKAADVMGWLHVASGILLLPIHDPAWLGESDSALAYEPTTESAHHGRRGRARVRFQGARGQFSRIRQPVLLLGRQDPTVPFATGERIAARFLGDIRAARPDAAPAASERPGWRGSGNRTRMARLDR